MSDQVVTLRIMGESGNLVAAVKVSKSELDSLGASAQAAGERGSAGIDQVGTSARRGKRDLDAMSGSVGSLATLLGGLGIAAMAKRITTEFITAADRAGQLEARIRNATSSQAEFNYVMERSGAIGRASYQSINTIGEIAINAAGPMRQLGFSIRDTLDLTEAMSLSLVASAANQQRSAATVDQFSKALQVGVLRGEAFNTVLSNAPEFVSALERALGKTRAEIIAMANAGQLTVGELTRVASQIDTLAAKVEAMPTTVEDAWTRFGDVFQATASKINKSSGATGVLVGTIGALGAALGPLVTLAGYAAVAFGGRLVVAMGAYAITQAKVITTEVGHQVAMRYGTVAAYAKATAMRSLNVAMAAFGGPVGLAITAMTLFVLWATNSAAAARQLSKEVQEGFQGALKTFQSFNRETANESFAGLKDSFELLEKARTNVERLAKEERDLADLRERQMARTGRVSEWQDKELANKRNELALQQLALEQLSGAANQTVAKYAELVLGQAGVTDATEAQRASVEESIRGYKDEGKTLDQLQKPMAEVIEKLFGLAAGARFAAADLKNLKTAAADVDWSDIDQSLDKQIKQAQLRHVERTQGKAASLRLNFAMQLDADGKDPNSDEGKVRTAKNEQLIALTLTEDRYAESVRAAASAESEAARNAAARQRELEQQAESQARYTAELERAEAELAGPLKVAEVERKQRLAELDAALKAHQITQADHTRAQAVASEQYRRTTSEIHAEQDVMARVGDDYREAIRLTGLSSQARRVEEEVIRRVSDAKRAGREMSAAEVEDLRRFIAHEEQALTQMELLTGQADDYERKWGGAIMSVSQAFGDFIVGGIKSFSDFGDALTDIARRFVGDIVSTFAEDTFGTPLKKWMQRAASGGFADAGGLGAGAGGGDSSGGLMGTVMGAVQSWISGGAAAAATGTAGAAAGAAGAAGGAGAAVGAGGAGAAAAGVAVIPIVGWIAAGMMASASAYESGWRIEGNKKNIRDTADNSGFLPLMTDTRTVMNADSLLQALGVTPKIAAILSGSSLMTKALGHKAPHVQQSGVMGSVGFSGLEGESYADIKAKGGWFRSDKYWTEKGTLDPAIDRAFDMAAARVEAGALELAKQMGVDVSGALAAVRIDIGKLVLDADPEKAKAQLEKKLSEVMASLTEKAVGALGFGALVKDGFAAADVLGALSVSIGLVTAGADKLGHVLTALERRQVSAAVEYFQGLALKNGTALGDEVTRVMGLLSDYSSLMTDVGEKLQTADLNDYQRAQLDVELGYRGQVKQANELAKALGLSGARAEDLAKIEALRAHNMAALQKQQEAQKNTFLEDLGVSDLSTLRDDQKLVESMQMLRDAVGGGDLQRAQQMAQQSLGLGRNLYASGRDYSGLYDEVTGLIDGMTTAGMDGLDDEQLDRIATLLEDLPQGIASAMFQLVVAPAPPAPITPWTPPTPVNPSGGGGNASTDQLLREMNENLKRVARYTGGQLDQVRSDSLHARVNGVLS